jgi:4-carboxymuconolactone decarboxylase
MARIKLYPTDDMSPEQQRVHQEIISGARGKIVGPLRAALHNAELADRMQKLGELLRFRTGLTPRLSELAILVTARHWDSQFEWFQHEPIARRAGVPGASVDAIARGEAPAQQADDEAAVHDYTRELLATHAVSAPVYQRALELLGERGVVELTALIGYYSMVALTLNAHEFDLPAGTPAPLPTLNRSAAPR